jgi:hypothetical protein
LGRASELNSFVKLGATDGHIEIELKGPAGKPNLVIKRNLTAKSKGSSFTLNGASATGTEIKTKVAELNVQVGNLWYVTFFSLHWDLLFEASNKMNLTARSFRKIKYQNSRK